MDMKTFTKQALESAMSITGKECTDEETQDIAFKLACAAMAEEHAKTSGTNPIQSRYSLDTAGGFTF